MTKTNQPDHIEKVSEKEMTMNLPKCDTPDWVRRFDKIEHHYDAVLVFISQERQRMKDEMMEILDSYGEKTTQGFDWYREAKEKLNNL